MDTAGVIGILVLFLLIFLSGFFSSAETALTTVNRVKIRTLVEEGNKRAGIVEKILDRYSKMLNAILIGNNIVNLSASSLSTTLVIDIWGNAYVGLATGVLTFVILLVGEIVPKTWASLNAEKISLSYAWSNDTCYFYCGRHFQRYSPADTYRPLQTRRYHYGKRAEDLRGRQP